jgi:hypothetical protein
MAVASAKALTNLLEIQIPQWMLNKQLWAEDSAMCVELVLEHLRLSARMYSITDPAKKTTSMGAWAFYEDIELRQAHKHYPSGQTAAAVALRRATHDLVKDLLIKIFLPYWSRAEEVIMGDYEDDLCVDAQHVHDAAGTITERNPQAAIFMNALRKEVFLGAEVHNKMMVEAINNLKGPTATTQAALMVTLGHLDHMDNMVKVHSCYQGCWSQFPTRRKELHGVLKKWNNHMKLPIILFIADERIKERAGTATLRGLIASLRVFLTTEIHERMTAPTSASGKTVVLATTTGCKLHGENARHTTAECKGIKRKREHDGGSNAKGKRPMYERQFFGTHSRVAVGGSQGEKGATAETK